MASSFPEPSASLALLPTEIRNLRTAAIDELPTLDMLRLISDEDLTVAAAVRVELPALAEVVDRIAARLAAGGRLFYLGAGTSGRLGVLDASECPPTFSVAPDLVQGVIAGGDSALRRSSEATEDLPEAGAQDLANAGFSAADALVGIAASGRTPYVLGAIAWARATGALTVALTCVPHSPLAGAAELTVTPLTGPEVITGSTRMKAGTATKLVLNMISTAVMVRRGAVFGNLMVNVQSTNAKLRDRAQRIVVAATGCDPATARDLLAQGGSVKSAIVMSLLSLTAEEARSRLSASHGILRQALHRS